MDASPYRYSPRATRNPLRYAGAVWRFLRRDLAAGLDPQGLEDAATIQMGFNRSKLGRRFARWEEAVAWLKRDPRTAQALRARRPFGPIAPLALERLPVGTLGRVFADHCRREGIDPNLVYIPPTDEVGWFLNHLYQTHDIWHVVSGWGTDLPGEVGLAGFYCAQLGSPAFFGYNLALILLSVVWRRGELGDVLEAFSVGFRSGRLAEPLFGVAWDELWETPLDEVRARFALDRAAIVGRGLRTAA